MKIIAVMGSICAGKDSLKDYLEKKYGYRAIKLGNILRGEAVERGININRDNLHKLSVRLNKKEPNYLVKRAIEDAEKRNIRKLIIGDIREVNEVKYLKKLRAKVKFIRVDADLEVRFDRIRIRRRAGDPETLSEFKRMDAKEEKRFNLKKLFKYADYLIVNNKGYEELYKDARELMRKIK